MSTEGVPQEAVEAGGAAVAEMQWNDARRIRPRATCTDAARVAIEAAYRSIRQQVLGEVREAMLLDAGPRLAADAVWTEIDGPLGRATTDESFKKLSDRDKDAIRFITGAAAALATLSNEEN